MSLPTHRGCFFSLSQAVLCLSSLLSSHADSQNTLRTIYRRDRPFTVPLQGQSSYSSCACAPACLSSADALNSSSIILSGRRVNTARKWAADRPLTVDVVPVKAKASKYSTLQGISIDCGHNHHELSLSFSGPARPVVKSW